jgi:uncharacterized damage-inducible protein DinB
MPPAVLEIHLDYSAWASLELVRAATRITEEELTLDFGTADGSLLGTLVHVFAADRIWLARVMGDPAPGYATNRDRDLAVLQSEWPRLHEQWKEWIRGLTPKSVEAPLSYTDMRGNTWTQPLWKIVLHVVNHGTHHRGQAAGFLRALGHTPPKLDLIHYYRETEKLAAMLQ